jgi:tetratricopeptide (TPR) repeat protein
MALCEAADRAYGDRVSWRNQFRLATLRYGAGEIGAAQDAIEKAVQQPFASSACWSLYAQILLELDETARALLAAGEALERAPGDLAALRVQAEALGRLGRHAEADRVLAQIEQAGGQPIQVQAQTLLSANRLEEAIALLRTALATDPGEERYARWLARILRRANRPDEAEAVVREGLAAHPESPELARMLLEMDASQTPAERDAAVLEEIEKVEDVFLREVRLAGYHSRRDNSREADVHLAEAQRLFLEKASPQARAAPPSALQDILAERLALALNESDWERAEKITATAIEYNTDSADGLTYLGRLHLAKGNFEEAAQALKGALEKQPTNSKTLLVLGEAYLSLQRFSEAKSAFERAAEINPKDGLAWKGQALIAYREGDDARLAPLIEQCQKLIPSDSWVREQATVLREMDEPQVGIERREKILEQNPDDLRNLVRLATLYQKTDQNDKAEELYHRALAEHPTDRALAWAAARFFSDTGRADDGLTILQKLVQSIDDTPAKAEAQLLVGAFFADRQDLARADAAYLAAADIQPTLDVTVRLGTHYFQTDRVRQAVEWLEKAIAIADREGSPQAARVRRMEIECYLNLRQKDEAKRHYEEYDKQYPDDVDGLRLRAEVELLYGQPDQAIATITRYLEQRPADPRMLYRRAQVFGSLEQWRRACADLEQIRAIDPTGLNYLPRILLSMGYDRTDRTVLAETELKAVLEQDPDADTVASELVRFYEKHERYLDAEKIVVARLARQPDSAPWLRVAGDIAAKLQDSDKALKLYRQAAQSGNYLPRFVAPYLDAHIQFKTFDEGISFYENELPADRRSPIVIYRYAHLLAQAGKTDLAVRNYLLAVDLAGIGSMRFLGEVTSDAVAALGRDGALKLFQAEPDDERLKRPAKQLTAALLDGLGRSEESVTAVNSLIETTQDDREQASLLVERAGLMAKLSNLEKAREDYEQALNLNPNDVVALNNLAYLLTDKLGAPQQALPYALKAAENDSSTEILDTLGWVYVKLGRYGDAISELTRAVQQNPDYIPGLVHLGEAHRRGGNFTNAENVLTSALGLLNSGRFAQLEEYRQAADASLQKTRDKQAGP